MPNTDYAPKHKRRLNDETRAGLPRWLRAADNAVRKPNSPGAKLYYRRVANAQRFREAFGDGSPVVFFKPDYRNSAVTDKRDAVACSFFCAAMHVQKQYLTEFEYRREGMRSYRNYRGEIEQIPNDVRYEVPVTIEQIATFFECDERTNLLSLSGVTLKRSVKCVVCETAVTS